MSDCLTIGNFAYLPVYLVPTVKTSVVCQDGPLIQGSMADMLDVLDMINDANDAGAKPLYIMTSEGSVLHKEFVGQKNVPAPVPTTVPDNTPVTVSGYDPSVHSLIVSIPDDMQKIAKDDATRLLAEKAVKTFGDGWQIDETTVERRYHPHEWRAKVIAAFSDGKATIADGSLTLNGPTQHTIKPDAGTPEWTVESTRTSAPDAMDYEAYELETGLWFYKFTDGSYQIGRVNDAGDMCIEPVPDDWMIGKDANGNIAITRPVAEEDGASESCLVRGGDPVMTIDDTLLRDAIELHRRVDANGLYDDYRDAALRERMMKLEEGE